MTRAYWFTPEEQGGFPVQRAAVGDCDLSVLHVGGEWHGLVRREGRDVAEGAARSADNARRQAEAVAARSWRTVTTVAVFVAIGMLAAMASLGPAHADAAADETCRKLKELAKLDVPPPAVGVPSPLGLGDTRLSQVRPREAFRAASGYYCDFVNNLPTMYAHSGNKLIVVGPAYEREFDLRDLDKALEEYRALVARQGYADPAK